MTIKKRIAADLKSAMKAGEKTKVSVLRMLNAQILDREVQLRSQKGRDYQLGDGETVEVIAGYAKQRRQSIASYQEGGRSDLVAQEESELVILQEYLPKQLSEEEVEALVEEAIRKSGASGLKEMGAVMKVLMPEVKGAADGKVVSETVRRKLSK